MSEVYVYPAENGYRKLKVGDGTTTLANLPWAGGATTSGGGTDIDLSSISQDVTIESGYDLTVGGDIRASNITITSESFSESNSVVTKAYLESVLLTGTW